MKNEVWEEEFNNLAVNDGRIIKRVQKFAKEVCNSPESSIPEIFVEWKDAKAAYDLLNNEKLTEEKLLEGHRKKTLKRMKNEKIILAIQDTTEANYDTLKGTSGLGPHGGKENSRGLIIHTTLAVTTKGIPLGTLNQEIWARKYEERGKSKQSRKRPLEEKESYKWIKSFKATNEGIDEDITIVNVCDREADFFEFLYEGIENDKKFVVRVKGDRIVTDNKKLFKVMNELPIAGEIQINVPRDSRRKTPERVAQLEIRSGVVEICTPEYLIRKYNGCKSIKINVIVAEEINSPKGEEIIKWMLFTNTAVGSLEEAVEKISWYVQRWKIERFHYVLKSGLKIEEVQFEKAEKIRRIIALYSIIAWIILWMLYISRENPEISCEILFKEKEWKILYCLINRVETPSNDPPTLNEAVVMIARLGGFFARKCDKDPGIKVLWRGLKKFHTIMNGIELVKNVITT